MLFSLGQIYKKYLVSPILSCLTQKMLTASRVNLANLNNNLSVWCWLMIIAELQIIQHSFTSIFSQNFFLPHLNQVCGE